MKHIVLFCLTFLFISNIHAQTYTWEEFAEDFFDQEQTETFSNDEEKQTFLEDLLDIHRNPFNINTITKEQLQELPFLTEQQTDSIVSYVKRYGPVLSLQELMLIPYLDRKTRDYLTLFVCCPDQHLTPYNIKNKDKIKKWYQQLVTTSNIPLYRRDGFYHYDQETLAQSPNKDYKGIPLATSLRYKGSWKNKIEWGITVQNDEGEPYAKYGNKVFDYQSFFVSGKTNKLIKKWIIGDYRAHFGMGLTMGKGFWNNGLGMLSFTKYSSQTLYNHTSSEETKFFRGTGIVLQLKNIECTLMSSYRQLDATISDNQVSTLLTSGLHRTQSELNRKNNLDCATLGANIDWKLNNSFNIGFSGVYTFYNKSFTTGSTLYKTYYMSGKNFSNYAIHYSYKSRKWVLQGESAIDNHQGKALLHTLTFIPKYTIHFVLSHRYYNKEYNAPYAFAYASSQHIKNEHGIYGGMNWTFLKKWNLKTYIDETYHPFAIYKASAPSYKTTFYSQLNYQKTNHLSFTIKYQFRFWQENNTNKTKLLPVYKNTLKLQTHYTLYQLKNITAIDLACYAPKTGKASIGKMISQQTSLERKNLTFSALLAWFNTDNYYSALHVYEPSPSYIFSFPSCFYHGWRGMLMVHGKINYKLDFYAKYGITYYTNKNTISSSQQLINHPYKNDLSLQLCWKF